MFCFTTYHLKMFYSKDKFIQLSINFYSFNQPDHCYINCLHFRKLFQLEFIFHVISHMKLYFKVSFRTKENREKRIKRKHIHTRVSLKHRMCLNYIVVLTFHLLYIRDQTDFNLFRKIITVMRQVKKITLVASLVIMITLLYNMFQATY